MIPIGLCQCGCGQKTTIAQYTDHASGVLKGEPRKFVHSHYHRWKRKFRKDWGKHRRDRAMKVAIKVVGSYDLEHVREELFGPAFEGAMIPPEYHTMEMVEASARAKVSEYLKTRSQRFCGKGMLFSLDQMRDDDEGGEPSFLGEWDDEYDDSL